MAVKISQLASALDQTEPPGLDTLIELAVPLGDTEETYESKKLPLSALLAILGIDFGTWTPVATFQTPGNLSVSYAQQIGTWLKIDDTVFITFVLQFTPTYTTASGQFRISGLPAPVVSDGLGSFQHGGANPVSYPAGVSSLLTVPTASVQQILALGNGSATTSALSVTQVTSGTERLFRGEAVYGA